MVAANIYTVYDPRVNGQFHADVNCAYQFKKLSSHLQRGSKKNLQYFALVKLPIKRNFGL